MKVGRNKIFLLVILIVLLAIWGIIFSTPQALMQSPFFVEGYNEYDFMFEAISYTNSEESQENPLDDDDEGEGGTLSCGEKKCEEFSLDIPVDEDPSEMSYDELKDLLMKHFLDLKKLGDDASDWGYSTKCEGVFTWPDGSKQKCSGSVWTTYHASMIPGDSSDLSCTGGFGPVELEGSSEKKGIRACSRAEKNSKRKLAVKIKELVDESCGDGCSAIVNLDYINSWRVGKSKNPCTYKSRATVSGECVGNPDDGDWVIRVTVKICKDCEPSGPSLGDDDGDLNEDGDAIDKT